MNTDDTDQKKERMLICEIHVADEIKDAGWERQLSSGVVLTGGGALLNGMAFVTISFL